MTENYLQYNHTNDAGYDLLLSLDKTPKKSAKIAQFLKEYTWAYTMSQVTGGGARAPHIYLPKLYVNGEYIGELTESRDLTIFLSAEDYVILPPLRAHSELQDHLIQFENSYLCPTRFDYIEPAKSEFLKGLLRQGINIAGFVHPRSGLGAKHKIAISNNTGVIDLSYRGNVMVALENRGRDFHMFTNGARIAQLVTGLILNNPYNLPAVKEDDRSTKGFGSSGVGWSHPADTSKQMYRASMLNDRE